MPARPRGVVVDVAALLTPPLATRVLTLYLLEAEGFEIVCRSFLGRGATRRLLREQGLLRYCDDVLYNERVAPRGFYEVAGPNDQLFQLIHSLRLVYERPSALRAPVEVA